MFQATCPYVTSVGGTVSFNPEVAWVGSSGGFSYYFKRPWYQQAAVGHYLDKYVSDETKDYYGDFVDFDGRGFPDVAAHSVAPEYVFCDAAKTKPSLTLYVVIQFTKVVNSHLVEVLLPHHLLQQVS